MPTFAALFGASPRKEEGTRRYWNTLGADKLCTRADMELFGLEWVRDW